MDVESVISIIVVILGVLLSAFKKSKPIEKPGEIPGRPTALPPHINKKEDKQLDAELKALEDFFSKYESPSSPVKPKVTVPPAHAAARRKVTPPPAPLPRREDKATTAPDYMREGMSALKSKDVAGVAASSEIGSDNPYAEEPMIFNSAEDWRRAIIANEILNRKY